MKSSIGTVKQRGQMDTTKLGEAGEMLGIGAGEPLEDITTITIWGNQLV